jgi:hypothetical protein
MDVVLEDFTSTELGAAVERCPRCGRNGVRESTRSGTVFLHKQSSELMCDGMLEEPTDCCSLDRE